MDGRLPYSMWRAMTGEMQRGPGHGPEGRAPPAKNVEKQTRSFLMADGGTRVTMLKAGQRRLTKHSLEVDRRRAPPASVEGASVGQLSVVVDLRTAVH